MNVFHLHFVILMTLRNSGVANLVTRATFFTGYLPQEILGTNIYEYIHPEDVANVSFTHQYLSQFASGTAMSNVCIFFMSESLIYNRYLLERHSNNSTFSHLNSAELPFPFKMWYFCEASKRMQEFGEPMEK